MSTHRPANLSHTQVYNYSICHNMCHTGLQNCSHTQVNIWLQYYSRCSENYFQFYSLSSNEFCLYIDYITLLISLLGCGGTANNFNTQVECEQQCVTGACCFRTPIPGIARGFNRRGHYPLSLQCAVCTINNVDQIKFDF